MGWDRLLLYPVNIPNYRLRMHQTKSVTISIIGLASLFYWFFSISLKKSTQSGLEPETSGLQDRRANHYTTEFDGDVSLKFPDLWSHSIRSSSIASLHLSQHVLTTCCVSRPPPEWLDPFREIGRCYWTISCPCKPEMFFCAKFSFCINGLPSIILKFWQQILLV